MLSTVDNTSGGASPYGLNSSGCHFDGIFRASIASIADGFIVTDDQRRVVYTNESAAKLLNAPIQEDLVGQDIEKILPVTDVDGNKLHAAHPVRYVIETKKSIVSSSSLSNYYYSYNGSSPIPVSVTISPIYMGDEFFGTVQVFQDSTWQQEIDRTRNEMVSFASHQLRTPLSAINWNSEALLKKDSLAKKDRRTLNYIYESSKGMTELVNALLNVSRFELGTIELDVCDIDLPEIVAQICEDYERLASLKNVTLEITSRGSSMPLSGDKRFVKMLLDNLISNAVKYTNQGVVGVYMDFSATEDQVPFEAVTMPGVLISVSDSGIGIPEQQQSQIFQKLFRADNARQEDVSGTGLGLYLTSLIVREMSGHVWFESFEGKGATFSVFLPIKR
ncbi:MAG: ATP-binding protein [Patescibacteria group bacterium]